MKKRSLLLGLMLVCSMITVAGNQYAQAQSAIDTATYSIEIESFLSVSLTEDQGWGIEVADFEMYSDGTDNPSDHVLLIGDGTFGGGSYVEANNPTARAAATYKLIFAPVSNVASVSLSGSEPAVLQVIGATIDSTHQNTLNINVYSQTDGYLPVLTDATDYTTFAVDDATTMVATAAPPFDILNMSYLDMEMDLSEVNFNSSSLRPQTMKFLLTFEVDNY